MSPRGSFGALCFAVACLSGCANGSGIDGLPDVGPVVIGDETRDASRDNAMPEEMFRSGDISQGTDTTNPSDVTSPGCDAGSTSCSGYCTDLDTDPTNCGKCGTMCTGICSMGHCCNVGQQYCSGSCIDTTMDPSNCGTCGMTCSSPDGTCCSSACTDTTSDSNNCGMCGMVCSGGGTCSASTCMTPCAYPQGSCSHSLCSTGGALAEGCDPDDCTLFVCYFGDPTCCTTAWTAACVADAAYYCGSSL